MEFKYKAKLVKKDEWVFFDLNTISKMSWFDGTFWWEIDESTICQLVGFDSNGDRFYKYDYVKSVMSGDYDPMITNGIICYDEDEYKFICVNVDNEDHWELQDFAFVITGENEYDK